MGPVTTGIRLLLVYTVAATGLALVLIVTGYASAGSGAGWSNIHIKREKS